MSEYRIDVKVRNNIILYKIEKAGYKTVAEFCRLNDIKRYVSILGDIIAMKRSPLTYKGEFLPAIVKTAELLNCDCEDFFTETQMHTILKTNKRSIQVNEAEMRFMIEKENNIKLLDDVIDAEKRDNVLLKSLETLTPREQKLIEMRYGLGEYSSILTLEECGKELDITRERVRQIEIRALRKLRAPHRIEELRKYIDDPA
jgi:DNA-directed RNA polymerase specialized sigma subunit